MVSLSRNYDTSSTQGGIFFNDNSLMADDTQLLHPITGPEQLNKFRPLDTIILSALHLSFSVGLVLVAIVLAAVWESETQKCTPYYIVLYLHAAFWCISWVVDYQLKRKHNLLRTYGYFDFYKEVGNHSNIPHHVVSGWTALLLVSDAVLHQVYPDFEIQCGSKKLLTPVSYIAVFLALETIVLLVFIGIYIKKVFNFNKKSPLPDAQRDEWLLQTEQEGRRSASEVGYRVHGDCLRELLERQADVITHLREHNARLSQKLVALSSRTNSSQPYSVPLD